MLLPALGLSALSACMFLVADGLPLLLAGRILSGLSAGIFTGTATATLVDLAPSEHRSRATLVAAVANMGGLGFGVLLAGLVSQWAPAPLRMIFWVDLALLLPAAIGIWAMPEPVTSTSHPRLRARLPRVPPGCARLRQGGARHLRWVRSARVGHRGDARFPRAGPRRHEPGRGWACRVLSVCRLDRRPGDAQLLSEDLALPTGCVGLIAGMALLALSLGVVTRATCACGRDCGLGQGLSFRAGLAAAQRRSPAAQRAEVASSFFVVAYIAISLPVIGEGALAQAVGLRTAGLAFAAVVAAVAAIALALLARTSRSGSRPSRAPVRPPARGVSSISAAHDDVTWPRAA